MWLGFKSQYQCHMWVLSLLLVLSFARRGFPLGTPFFPSPQKPTIPNFQFDQESPLNRYLFIYLLFSHQPKFQGLKLTWWVWFVMFSSMLLFPLSLDLVSFLSLKKSSNSSKNSLFNLMAALNIEQGYLNFCWKTGPSQNIFCWISFLMYYKSNHAQVSKKTLCFSQWLIHSPETVHQITLFSCSGHLLQMLFQ